MFKKNPTIRISIFNSLIKALNTMLVFFLAIHFININLSGFQIGLIFAVNSVTNILTILPSGFSNDRFRSRTLITISLILMAIPYLGLAFTNQFYLIVFSFFLGSIGINIYRASATSLFYKSTKKKEIHSKIAVYQGLGYFAQGITTILVGYLLHINYTFENLFLIVGILFLLFSILSELFLPKNKTAKFEIIHYKKDILRAEVLFFLLIIFLFALHIGAEITSYGPFLKDFLKLNSFYTGLYIGGAILFMSGTVLLISKIIDKLNLKFVFLIGLFLSGIGLIFMPLKPVLISSIFRIIHEIGDTAVFFFLFYGISQLFDLKRIGGNNGIFLFVISIGITIGSLIYGPLGETYGYFIPMIIGGITTIFALLISLPYSYHFEHK